MMKFADVSYARDAKQAYFTFINTDFLLGSC